MKPSMLKIKTLGLAIIASLSLGAANTAKAELITLPALSFPLVTFDNTGTTTFDPNTGILKTEALPIAGLFSASTPPRFINPVSGSESVSINIEVDSSGNLIGGVAGDDLLIIGEITDGDGNVYSGTLLTAEVLEFGFQDDGNNDLYNYTFSVTGGALAAHYPMGSIGISITSENSTFTDFTSAFEGGSKGTFGGIPTIVTQCSIEVLGTCVVEMPPTKPACDAKIAATTFKYTGPDLYNATVEFVGKNEGYASYTTDLISGVTILTSAGQNGYTIDARPTDLGSKLSVYINGEEEIIHTSCSVPYTVGLPPPLNPPKSKDHCDTKKGSKSTKGSDSSNPASSNWTVIAFVDKEGDVVETTTTEPALACEIPAKGSASVTFGYQVTNSGSSIIDSTEVNDLFGIVPNTPIGTLNPGDSVTLERTETLSAETENVITVSGNASGVSCDNLTAVTIHKAKPDHYCPTKKGSKKPKHKGSKGSDHNGWRSTKYKGSKGSDHSGWKSYKYPGSKD